MNTSIFWFFPNHFLEDRFRLLAAALLSPDNSKQVQRTIVVGVLGEDKLDVLFREFQITLNKGPRRRTQVSRTVA